MNDRERRLSGESTFAWDMGGGARLPETMRQGGVRDFRDAVKRIPSGERRPMPSRHTAAASAPQPTPRPSQGVTRGGRATTVRAMLDVALTRWWATGELPPCWLLRDGLILLETGKPVNEPQRTLLLRTALACGKGIVTALKHHGDDERTILLLHEALTAWRPPLQASFLAATAHAADQPWHEGLTVTLRHTAQTTRDPEQRANALDALQSLGVAHEYELIVDYGRAHDSAATRTWFRRGLLAALLVLVVSAFWWQQGLTAPADMATVPAGAYWQRVADGRSDTVLVRIETDRFYIDRYEVTNGDYRRCTAAGACPRPVDYASATRPHYFTDPAYSAFPVVHVTLAHAMAYCVWRGKRLPTVVEWQVAAGDGSGSGALSYPWGETFAPQWANSAASGLGDTLAVGAYRPAGDSWLGVADLAGNVAEWTATAAAGAGLYQVRGGSFRSDPDELTVHYEEQIAAATATDWLGFRCAASRPPERW